MKVLREIPQTHGTNSTVDPGLRRGDANNDVENIKLTEDALSENQRAARYLASRDGIGEFSKFVADGIETDGDKAIAETVDLYRQTAEMNQDQADALIKKVKPGLSNENAKRLQSAIKNIEQDGSETISMGIWPDGDGPSQKIVRDSPSNGEDFNDSASDDEMSDDDDLRFSRDTHDMALQHLIEGGVDPEIAKEFLDRLPEHSPSSESDTWMIDTFKWISNAINPQSKKGNVIKGETGTRG